MCFFYLFIYYLFWFLRLTFVHYINASSQTGLYIYNMTFSLQQTTKQYWYQKLLYVYYWIILWRSKIEYSSVTFGCRENCFSFKITYLMINQSIVFLFSNNIFLIKVVAYCAMNQYLLRARWKALPESRLKVVCFPFT